MFSLTYMTAMDTLRNSHFSVNTRSVTNTFYPVSGNLNILKFSTT